MQATESEKKEAREHLALLNFADTSADTSAIVDISHALQSLARSAEGDGMARFLKEIGAAEVLDRVTQVGNASERALAERGLLALGIESREKQDARKRLSMSMHEQTQKMELLRKADRDLPIPEY